MGNLECDLLALTVCKVDYTLQGSLLRILPKTAVFRGDSSLRSHSGGLDHGKTRSALDDASHVCQVPIGLMAVLGRVLAKR